MTAHHDLDGQLNDFLREGPEELPYQSFDAVRDRTEHTGQRVVVGPWRFPDMNKFLAIGLGAAAVVVAAFIGAQVFGSPGGGLGSAPTATPQPTASPEPSPSPAASVPPLAQSFTSTQHGISLSYPEGWTAEAATEPWTGAGFVFNDPVIDVLYDPILRDHLFLAIASEPTGDTTPDEWVAEKMALQECAATEPITVDGAVGLIGAGDCKGVAVTTDGRGYIIRLYTSDDEAWLSPTFDRAWFEEVLATVQLRPEDAVD